MTRGRSAACSPAVSRGCAPAAVRATLTGAIMLLVLLTWSASASAYSSAYLFTINGHGWGHGVGMSQWGACGYAKRGAAYKDILRHYYTGISFGTSAGAMIRVNLRSGRSVVKLTCPRPYTVRGTGATVTIPARTTASTTWTGSGYRVVAGSLNRTFNAAPTFTPTAAALRVITKTDLGASGAYRGAVKVVRSGSGLMMINVLPVESYLRGVVPLEVSPAWPREALKAQACAARSFALGSRQPKKRFDVYCDVRDQVYKGVAVEDARTDAAVRATAGVCPTYKDKPILATYFSSSGGQTESVVNVWGGSHPYLRGVDDPYDSSAPLHDWGPLRRTPSQLAKSLGAKGSLRAVYRVKRGVSPRIVKAAIIGSRGTTYIDGNSLRMKLGLYSTWAVFRSMSISPSARDRVAIGAGAKVTLRGRLYPALANGAKVTLRSYCNGAWRSTSVTTKRVSQSLPNSYTARYSTYSIAVAPTKTTKYYFASGTAKSPTTTVTVN